MITNQFEAMEFVKENDVEFIRLQFCDIFGELKNISIMASQLEKAFEYGISFDASSVKGFLNVDKSDLFLFPDPKTLNVLPWRPQQGRVVRFLCDIKYPNGNSFFGDSRNILKRSVQKARDMGYTFKVGPECEFYLFKTDENGNPTLTPHDNSSYFGVAPCDKGENVRRDICLTLKEMGLVVEGSHHESGTGQHEIDIRYDHALVSADNLITLKSVVKTLASRNGLFASFMPKPIEMSSGSGMHINMSLEKNGKNIFDGVENKQLSDEAKSFIAGILAHIKSICLFTNPIVNSYKRLVSGFEAPKYISWSYENRSQLIRIPASKGDNNRIELRNPDAACNPYLVYALLLNAGLDGIKKNLVLAEETNLDLYTNDSHDLELLPANLHEAVQYANSDELIADVLGENVLQKYISFKMNEWNNYQKSITQWEIDNYFNDI